MKVFIIMLCFMLCPFCAEAKIYTTEVESPLSYNTTINQIQDDLQQQARENIASQCCTYIQSSSLVSNGFMINDEIKSIIVGYMKETNKSFVHYTKDNSIYIKCHYEADVDEQKSSERLDALIKQYCDETPDNCYKMANQYFEHGEFGTAFEYYKKAQNGGSKYSDLFANMSLCAYYISDTEEEFDYANELALKSIEYFPNEPIAYLTAGIYAQQANPKQAICYLQKLVELNPNILIAYKELMDSYEKMFYQHIAKMEEYKIKSKTALNKNECLQKAQEHYNLANQCLINAKTYGSIAQTIAHNNNEEDMYVIVDNWASHINSIYMV